MRLPAGSAFIQIPIIESAAVCSMCVTGHRRGHTCLPKENLLHRASVLLGVEEEQMETQLMNLCMDRKLVMKEQNGKVMVWYGRVLLYGAERGQDAA